MVHPDRAYLPGPTRLPQQSTVDILERARNSRELANHNPGRIQPPAGDPLHHNQYNRPIPEPQASLTRSVVTVGNNGHVYRWKIPGDLRSDHVRFP